MSEVSPARFLVVAAVGDATRGDLGVVAAAVTYTLWLQRSSR
jgi:hypothetical protein